MEQKIREALAKLDVNNDNHWTAEGMPRLDVMKDLVGTAVSRADITSAAKGFTRKTPDLETKDEVESTGSGESADAQATQPQETQGDEEESEEGQTETRPEHEELPEELVADGDKEIEEELEAATKAADEANNRLRKAKAAMDVVKQRRAREAAKVSDAHTIKAYQASQNKQREASFARQRAMAEAMAKHNVQY